MPDYVVFFPRTGVTRIFESYNMAQEYYPGMPIYTKTEDLIKTLSVKEITDGYAALIHWAAQRGSIVTNDAGVAVARDHLGVLEMPVCYVDDGPTEVARRMWQVMLLVGNRIAQPVKIRSESGSDKGFMFNLAKAREFRDRIKKGEDRQPRQVLAMLEFFIEQSYDYYTRTEIRRLTNSSDFYRALKTKQDGWRIFRYYKTVLAANGVLTVAE